jgi:hypothetical protein
VRWKRIERVEHAKGIDRADRVGCVEQVKRVERRAYSRAICVCMSACLSQERVEHGVRVPWGVYDVDAQRVDGLTCRRMDVLTCAVTWGVLRYRVQSSVHVVACIECIDFIEVIEY